MKDAIDVEIQMGMDDRIKLAIKLIDKYLEDNEPFPLHTHLKDLLSNNISEISNMGDIKQINNAISKRVIKDYLNGNGLLIEKELGLIL